MARLKTKAEQIAPAAPLLDLGQVRTFVAIAEEGSFIRAAGKLHMSQPSVSQHMSKLEGALRAQLFRRNRGECSPTADGERLLPHARAFLAAEQRCRASIASATLSIAASSNIGVYHLPRLLRRFQEQGGSMDIKVAIGSNAEVYRRIESQEADIGLTEWWDKRERFSAVEWHKEKLLVIVSPRHPWAKRRQISAADLVRTPLIGGETGTGTAAILREVLGIPGALKVSMALGSTEAVKQAVMEGLGISIVMNSAVENEVAHGRLKALAVTGKALSKPLFAVFLRGLSDDSLPGSFVSFIS